MDLARMDETPSRVVPAAVTTAIWLVWAIVALSGVTAALTWMLRDEMVRVWARDNGEARAVLREGGVEALDKSAIAVPEFVPLAVTSFAVVAGLALVLAAFLRSGHPWARWSLVALVVFGLLTTGLSVNRGVPVAFLALAVLALVLHLGLLRFLFHRDTNEFLRIE